MMPVFCPARPQNARFADQPDANRLAESPATFRSGGLRPHGSRFALGSVTITMPPFFSTFIFSTWTGPGSVKIWE